MTIARFVVTRVSFPQQEVPFHMVFRVFSSFLYQTVFIYCNKMSISGRAVYYISFIGNRAKSVFFYRRILGMKVLRHAESSINDDTESRRVNDNRWSSTFLGYGSEATHFVIMLSYKYGTKCCELGNGFGGITIKSKEIIERANSLNYPITEDGNGLHELIDPDGNHFFIINEPQPNNADPVQKITLNSSNLKNSLHYWNELLAMKIVSKDEKLAVLSYGDNQAKLQLKEIAEPIIRNELSRFITFAVTLETQHCIDAIIKQNQCTIVVPLVEFSIPGKASFIVIVVADPDGHEICFIDEETLSAISQVDSKGEQLIEYSIKEDPFQDN